MNNARENILQRLGQLRSQAPEAVPRYLPRHGWSREQRIENFSRQITSVHAEVHRVQQADWLQLLVGLLREKDIRQLLISDTTPTGKTVVSAKPEKLQFLHYQQEMENWKTDLFTEVDAGLTETRGAIAETGSLVLWPGIDEPRLISLVPPVHIAILDADRIFETFAQAVSEQEWAEGMPSNALLISGPSKTADIEQVLAYGVHGPKELVVIIRE